MSNGHARLGPSNKRWPVCAGSVREEEKYEDIPGEAAIDGTGSHLLLEMCLQNNVPAHVYDQQIIGANHPDNPNGWLVDLARVERVQMALDYITRRVAELKESFPGCNVAVESETTSDPGGAFGRTDWWGTCDITITARHPLSGDVYFIEVADYKDGRGYVSEKNNSQNISYLFGKMRKYIASGTELVRPFANANFGVRTTIIQPKTNPAVRYQCSTQPDDNLTVATVIEAAEKLAWAAHLTDDSEAPLTPGKHCQWCKANPKRGGHCTAESDQSLQVVETMSTELTGNLIAGDSGLHEYFSAVLADPKSLTEDQLSELADAEPGIQAVFDKVRAEIKDRIAQGITVKGYAMQPGKGTNVWNADEETVAKKLRSRRLKNADIYPAKLISPAAMMKLDSLTTEQKERIKKDLVTYTAGKLTLKKVAHDVAQSATDGVQLMFAGAAELDAAKPVSEVSDEVSFL